MNEDLNTKLFIAFCGAMIAIALKLLVDYVYRRIELRRIKLVLVNDLHHHCSSSIYFIKEKQKLFDIYKEALDEISNGRLNRFNEKLQTTIFKEVFFSDETFKTIKKSDLLSILRNNHRSFGEIHNIYHVSNRLKDRSLVYYEDQFHEHLLAYIGENKNQDNIIKANKSALQFITMKLDADLQTAKLLQQMCYKYLSKMIGETNVRSEFGLYLE